MLYSPCQELFGCRGSRKWASRLPARDRNGILHSNDPSCASQIISRKRVSRRQSRFAGTALSGGAVAPVLFICLSGSVPFDGTRQFLFFVVHHLTGREAYMVIMLIQLPGPEYCQQLKPWTEYPFKKDSWDCPVGCASATFLCRSIPRHHLHFLRGRQA